MRSIVLFPLFASLSSLPGVGPALTETFRRLTGPRVIDLLWHLPQGIIDRRLATSIFDVSHGDIATFRLRIEAHEAPRSPRQPYRILCDHASGRVVIVFFNARGLWLLKTFPVGEIRIVSGHVQRYGDILQIVHPDYVVPEDAAEDSLPTADPVYPLTAGLNGRTVRKTVQSALERVPDLDEWLDPDLLANNGWPRWREALAAAHRPCSEADTLPLAPARMRLAYDELLAHQLAITIVQKWHHQQAGRCLQAVGNLAETACQCLDFTLTSSQQLAWGEIRADLARPVRMLRLLQGDVGSGKTVVALLAMLIAVEAGTQAALMAPTEVLCRQHLATIAPLASAAGVTITLLTGRESQAVRRAAIIGLASGYVDIIVGTQALLEATTQFHDLGLVVIDEQHRFGVEQRLALANKGSAVDMLLMSATPIPRTLSLALYGDLAISQLKERPPGRQPIDTRVLSLNRLNDVIQAIGRAISRGAKVYWICPLVEQSEMMDAVAAEERFAALSQTFPGQVALVHGRLKPAERDQAMSDFREGRRSVLVATTVIEVGVDVADATVMVIEHAERFGLAQLHQLRGRVGRGEKSSSCLLVYAPSISDTARNRLAILRETDDGFRIAEEDLRLRGAGDVLGIRQSGLPDFRLASLAHHAELLSMAADEARKVIERDPELRTSRGAALKVLLYLFERDAAIGTLRAG